MSDLEKLAAIRAWCVNALENIASKRTPGKWCIYDNDGKHEFPGIECGNVSIVVFGRKRDLDYSGVRTGINDTRFITSCAGPAEAGWRATIAVIDAADCIGCPAEYEHVTKSILAAWEGQV